MKLNYWLLVLSAAAFSACQSTTSPPVEKDNTTTIATQQNCYTYTKNRDTANLSLISSGHIVTGELRYQLYEKDSNKGLIKGEMRGDTLVADYSFESEGKASVRQVAFLNKDGNLLEGFGDVVEKDGKVVFKNLSTLKFGEAIEFTKTPCN